MRFWRENVWEIEKERRNRKIYRLRERERGRKRGKIQIDR